MCRKYRSESNQKINIFNRLLVLIDVEYINTTRGTDDCELQSRHETLAKSFKN